ncbi:MAG: hypothetical protein HY706_15850 [Candidatus Hydrogenedentes bacterium]|nr:hypothetical protein [Candidatus Hydrogenedentota bacterium]
MAEQESKPARHVACKYIRNKEMFYKPDPFEIDEFSSGIFWCAKTHDGIGPDGKAVDTMECSPRRQCFQD